METVLIVMENAKSAMTIQRTMRFNAQPSASIAQAVQIVALNVGAVMITVVMIAIVIDGDVGGHSSQLCSKHPYLCEDTCANTLKSQRRICLQMNALSHVLSRAWEEGVNLVNRIQRPVDVTT